MRLAEDLLEQAQHLVGRDSTKPKQANLRRAVSTAYYSVFHLLIAEAVHRMLAGKDTALMDRVSRAFVHSEMKQVCRQLQQATLPAPLQELFDAGVSKELKLVARSFNDLQEARHSADYDVGARFSRSAVQSWVDMAGLVFQVWPKVPEKQARRFLTALAFGARWSK